MIIDAAFVDKFNELNAKLEEMSEDINSILEMYLEKYLNVVYPDFRHYLKSFHMDNTRVYFEYKYCNSGSYGSGYSEESSSLKVSFFENPEAEIAELLAAHNEKEAKKKIQIEENAKASKLRQLESLKKELGL